MGWYGSTRARRAKEDRSFTVLDRAVAPQGSAVPRIADAQGGAGRKAECRLDGAHREPALRRPPAPYAAQPTTIVAVGGGDVAAHVSSIVVGVPHPSD